jgi:hypothetical protein
MKKLLCAALMILLSAGFNAYGVQLFVSDLFRGGTKTIDVDQPLRISDIKQKISEETGARPEFIEIIFNRRVYSDAEVLPADYYKYRGIYYDIKAPVEVSE